MRLLMYACLMFTLCLSAIAETVTVNTGTRFQTIEGWGTCLAGWTGTNYLDPNFQAAYRDAGCNILRVPIDQTSVDPNCGGTPVTFSGNVVNDAGLINLNMEAFQPFVSFASWLKDNALEPSRVKISASPWTPPHWMKGPTGCNVQGKPNPKCSTFGGDSIGGRLVQTNDATQQTNRTQFARYYAAWLYKWKLVVGLPISYASIQNELSYENPFSSCTYRVNETCADAYWQWARALRAIYDQLSANGQLAETQLMGPHEAGIGEVDSNPWQLLFQTSHLQGLQDLDPTLYNALSIINNNGYVSETKEAARCWDAQVRGINTVPGAWPAWSFPPLMHNGIGTGKRYWVSEGDGVFPENAMAYSVRMHNALVHGRVSAYVSWQMSDGATGETEHILLGTNNWATPHNSLKYCNFKHFARYIRPGAQRVAATFSNGEATVLGADRWDANSGLSVSAYVHDADNRTTVVVINRTGSSQPVNFNGLPDGSYTVYQTRSTDTTGFNQLANMSVSGGAGSISVPAGSVTTLTTGSGGGGNPQPPAAPTGLAATPGNQQVALSWTASSGATSYNVKRSTTSGSGYSTIASPTTTSHTDSNLTNGTTYYYVVSAVNSVGESGNSSQVSATPSAGCTASTMHVSSIAVSTVSAGSGSKRGQAVVTVLDNCGNPVAGATVTGNFTGSIVESGRTGVTNSSGAATIQTNGTKKGSVSITFCVTNITKSGLSYNAPANVETCDSGS